MNEVTTVRKGFRVEDITFRGARKQSEIQKELPESEEESLEVQIPVSLTPEQVKKFIQNKSDSTQSMQERKVYAQINRWIDELIVIRKELLNLRSKEEVYNKVNSEVGDI